MSQTLVEQINLIVTNLAGDVTAQKVKKQYICILSNNSSAANFITRRPLHLLMMMLRSKFWIL
jgi:hypothetical protein